MTVEYFEWFNGARGAGNDGRPTITTHDGRTVVGVIQPAPACYATPTLEPGDPVEFWPVMRGAVPDPAHRYLRLETTYVDDVPARTVSAAYAWVPMAVDAAAADVLSRIDRRWDAAMDGGAPVTVPNGQSTIAALVRYEERDRNRYAAVHDPAKVPDPGLVVIAVEPPAGFDRTRFVVGGATKIAAILDQTLAHRNLGDLAWNTGYDGVQAIVDGTAPDPPPGGWTDEAKVAALAAYDVEALGWPENEAPVV